MMLASKNEEVKFIHVDSVVKNVVYSKFSAEELKKAELTILQAIDFRVNSPTLHDLCECSFRFVNLGCPKKERFFQNTCRLLVKTCLFSTEILDHFQQDEIVALSMIVVLKILEKLSPE